MSSTNVLRDFSSHLTFRSCVTCDTEPVCNCAAGESCIESSRTCTACPTTTCMPAASTSAPSSTSSSGGSNAGAIAGGVIGGIACVAIVVFLIWWFVIRKRRQAQAAAQPAENSVRHERSRSMQSIASTVLTRASNVIQIAYIPGVTNRSSPETPGTLVPPVPAIPSTHVSTYSGDQYLFTPRDLRDSRYTATSDRRSIATSLARSSVATTIYRHDAIVSPVPAQQVRAAKAAVVSVKTGNNTPSDSLSLRTVDAPAVPAITEAQLQKAGKIKPQLSSIVARSVVARPVNVKGPGSKTKVPTVSEEETHSDDSESAASHSRAKQLSNQNSTFDDSSDDSDDDEVNEKGHSNPAADNIQIALSSPQNEGPFSDSHVAGTPRVTVSTATSIAPSAATEAVSTSRASMDSNNGSSHRQRTSIGSAQMLDNAIAHDAATHRSSSPFDDQHEIK
ncbi:conserved hypothetical protein [Talaromyces stipitatus ATCC 10500]|uniref:Membrane anchor Opy2 N-terminal domain-containing protein n=1 Tax=Talaromyces stipitatus (strain ATCC 10500 / CBS 375.48 / QM 6759 / NRRL 1006) TaxID=441959 RepID=B8MS23_TALSN|nr:uncharacterized protein TSTA_002670 [Talaromyces stipitatus ATCC 10500]EED12201.1 conserved hypothetical protein [Talaromyces stipitatus ATCC 10500]